MRSIGTPAELERRRRLAVERVLEGYSTQEVGEFLQVDPRTVRRWVAAWRNADRAGLAAVPAPGRPRKLTATQEKIVRRWLSESPTQFGFATELWTARRLAQLIEQEWEVRFNRRYLSAWLRARGFSPQKPQRLPRERDEQAIARWLDRDWPRIKKRRVARGPIWP